MATAIYQFLVDTLRTGSYASSIDDLTSRLIGTAEFNFGMTDASQDFATPSRLTVQLDNTDGAFNPETAGSELITNGNFATWAGSPSAPSSWTVTGQVASDPIISQVAYNNLFGGGGTGAANFFASSAVVSISQVVLTVGTTYKVTLDVSASSGGTGWIALYSGSTRVSAPYHLTGSYTVYFNATNTTFKIASSGAVNMTIDNVSVKATSLYGQLLSEGTLGIFSMNFSFQQTMFVGRLTSFTTTAGSISRRIATLVFIDPMLDLLDTEYSPPLYTNTTADVPMADVFIAPVVPFPYAENYWILGIQGSSELDVTTAIYNPPSYSFSTGKSIYSWVGDNTLDKTGALAGQGASAQTFLRDLVAGEVGGRFYFDANLGGYIFSNRHSDSLTLGTGSPSYAFTDSDYEPDTSVYVREPVLNHSTVSYQPRKAGTAGSIIWTAPHPMTLLGNKTVLKITARYQDATNPSARIGATNVIPLFAGTDYIAIHSDGVTDVTLLIGATMVAGANSADLTFTSNNTFACTITYAQIRGTPLTTFNPQSAESTNGDSAASYKKASERINYNLIDTEPVAQAIADYRVYKNSTPVVVFEKIGFIANKSAARMNFAQLIHVGNWISITDTYLNHSASYFVVGGKHQITWGGEHTHATTFNLKPALREAFWILGTSLLDTQTILGL